MLFQPTRSTQQKISAYFSFRKNQKKIEMTSKASNKGNIRPSQEMNHHFAGSRYGARQANRNTIARIKFNTNTNFLMKLRNLLAIHAIYKCFPGEKITDYKSSWLALFNNSFSSSVKWLYPFWLILSRISSIFCCVRFGVFL